MRIREALRLRAAGHSNVQIAGSRTVACARSTLVELFRRCDNAGITYENSQAISDGELETLLYPRKHMARHPRQELDEAHWLKREAESGKTRMAVWQDEYLPANPEGLSYPRFCTRLKQYQKNTNPKLDYPKQRKAGEVMETDWCGEKPALIYDQETGTFQKTHIFVAALGFSQRIFARAFPDEKQVSWIDGHTKALEYYGALPRIVTPDNTKTAIKQPNRYEPEKNPVFSRWATHYNVAIIPARIKKPKDKDRVEDAVGWVEQAIFPLLKEQVFFSFSELNIALLQEVEKLNDRPYQKRPGSRSEIYLQVDKPAMRPLPAHSFQNPETRWAKVSKNGYHVQFDGRHYSAPFQLAGKEVLLSATGTTVELLYDNRRVALHRRCYAANRLYVTDPAHMPPRHLAQHETDCMTAAKYLDWAGGVGPSTRKVIATLLARYEIQEQAYGSCMGILRLADQHSQIQLESACRRACQQGVSGYRQIRALIEEQAMTIKEDRPANCHTNLRGGQYYTNGR